MTDLIDRFRSSPIRWFVLGALIVFVVGVGMLIGTFTAPGEWYQELEKPPFNPPNWIFAPVWTALYAAIAIGGWRILMRAPNSAAMKLWGLQLILNWLWSPIFFTMNMLWPALVVILAAWLSIVAFMVIARRVDIVSTWLFAPYLAWISFAALLNLSVAILN